MSAASDASAKLDCLQNLTAVYIYICLPRISALFFRSASGLLEFEARRVLNLYTQQSPLPSQDQAHNLGW